MLEGRSEKFFPNLELFAKVEYDHQFTRSRDAHQLGPGAHSARSRRSFGGVRSIERRDVCARRGGLWCRRLALRSPRRALDDLARRAPRLEVPRPARRRDLRGRAHRLHRARPASRIRRRAPCSPTSRPTVLVTLNDVVRVVVRLRESDRAARPGRTAPQRLLQPGRALLRDAQHRVGPPVQRSLAPRPAEREPRGRVAQSLIVLRRRSLFALCSLLGSLSVAPSVRAAEPSRVRRTSIASSSRPIACEVDGELGSLQLDGNVHVQAQRYRLKSQHLELQRGPRGVEADGAADVAFCTCDDPPVKLRVSRALLAPPTDALFGATTLELGGLPILWLPGLWLRAPTRVGLTFPRLSYRGAGRLLRRRWRLPPARARATAESRRASPLGAGAYLLRGARLDAELDTEASSSRVAWDHVHAQRARGRRARQRGAVRRNLCLSRRRAARGARAGRIFRARGGGTAHRSRARQRVTRRRVRARLRCARGRAARRSAARLRRGGSGAVSGRGARPRAQRCVRRVRRCTHHRDRAEITAKRR